MFRMLVLADNNLTATGPRYETCMGLHNIWGGGSPKNRGGKGVHLAVCKSSKSCRVEMVNTVLKREEKSEAGRESGKQTVAPGHDYLRLPL